MPPESSWGYWAGGDPRRGVSMPTRSRSSRARSSTVALRDRRARRPASATWLPIVKTGLRAGHRLLEDRCAEIAAAGERASRSQVRSSVDRCLREALDRYRRSRPVREAAARSKAPPSICRTPTRRRCRRTRPRLDLEGDAVDSHHGGVAHAEFGPEILDLQDGAHRTDTTRGGARPRGRGRTWSRPAGPVRPGRRYPRGMLVGRPVPGGPWLPTPAATPTRCRPIAVFAVIVVVGYLLIVRRRRWNRRPGAPATAPPDPQGAPPGHLTPTAGSGRPPPTDPTGRRPGSRR